MYTHVNSKILKSFLWFSKLTSLAVIALGVIVLSGWILGIQNLKSVFPGFATMSVNAALAFILAGVALQGETVEKPGSAKRWITQVAALIVTVLGLLTLAEYIFNISLGIDQLFFTETSTPENPIPGRMSLITALNFGFLGISLFLINRESNSLSWFSQSLTLPAGLIASSGLIGYIFDVTSLYQAGSFSSMALHTSIGFILLSIGILCAQPQVGWMKVTTTEAIGSMMLRRMFPLVIGIPIGLGLIILFGQKAELYSARFGIVALVILNMTLLGAALWISTASLNRVDGIRQRAEVKLQENQGQFAGIFNSAMDAIISINEEQIITIFNPAAEAMFQRHAEEVLGMPLTILIPERLHTNHAEDIKVFGQTSVTKRTMGRLGMVFGLRVNGDEFPVEASISKTEIGAKKVYTAILRDITERTKAEEEIRKLNLELEQRVNQRTIELQESEEKFSKAFLNSPAAVSIVSLPDGRYINVNEALAKLTGYSREELIGRTSVELGLIDEASRAKMIEATEKQGFVRNVEIQIHTKSKRVAEVLTSVEHIEVGGYPCMLSVNYDITERKQAEAEVQRLNRDLEQRQVALSEANNLLQTLLDHMPDHIYFKDLESRFIRNSKSQAKMMGLDDPAEIIGKTDFDFFPEVHAQRSYNEEQNLIRSGQPLIDIEERVLWPDNRLTWVSTTKLPLRNAQGQIMGTFGISRDITKRKQADEELIKSNLQLEAANKELEAFSYSVSHDLRAPLRTIDGFSLALLEDYGNQLPAEAQGYLTRVRNAAQHMAELIDDLLNLSRVTRSVMKSAPTDLSRLAQGIVTELRQTHKERSVNFDIAPNLKVQGDPNLLQVVLENLLNNAWKFTSKQEQARIEFGSKTENGETIYFIRDNGAGFDMAYAGKLFGAFQRLHTMTEFPGTGVGLATVQRIIQRHGGRVWAEAAKDQGATFFFTLPSLERTKLNAARGLESKDSIAARAKEII